MDFIIYEMRIQRKDGTILPVEVNANIIDYNGKPADLVILRDISERKIHDSEMKSKMLEIEAECHLGKSPHLEAVRPSP